MNAKYAFGMITGLAVGSALGMAVKYSMDTCEAKQLKKKVQKTLDKVEKYVNENVPFSS